MHCQPCFPSCVLAYCIRVAVFIFAILHFTLHLLSCSPLFIGFKFKCSPIHKFIMGLWLVAHREPQYFLLVSVLLPTDIVTTVSASTPPVLVFKGFVCYTPGAYAALFVRYFVVSIVFVTLYFLSHSSENCVA